MNKLLELEKQLKQYQDFLEKQFSSMTINPSAAAGVNTAFKSEDVKIPKKEFVDEHEKLVDILESDSKEDDRKEAKKQKKELEEAKKCDMKKTAREQMEEALTKGLGADLDRNESRERVKAIINDVRNPAKVIDEDGNETIVSPEKQVSDRKNAEKQRIEAARAEAEEKAAARRAEYRKQGLLKSDESISFDSNGQWDLRKTHTEEDTETLEKGTYGKAYSGLAGNLAPFSNGSEITINRAVSDKKTGQTHGYHVTERKKDGSSVEHPNVPQSTLDQAMQHGDNKARLRMGADNATRKHNLHKKGVVSVMREGGKNKNKHNMLIHASDEPHKIAED